jgi:hypothetical protein
MMQQRILYIRISPIPISQTVNGGLKGHVFTIKEPVRGFQITPAFHLVG